jgi:hypothetical protein
MRSFFTAFGVISLFTVLAKFGVVKFDTLRAENIAKENFQFFVYLYLMLTGVLAASSYERRSWFRSFIQKFTGVVKSFYLGTSGSLVGWCFGLLVYVILSGKFESIAFGLVLTSYMLLFALVPAWCHEHVKNEKEQMIGYIFREPRFG